MEIATRRTQAANIDLVFHVDNDVKDEDDSDDKIEV